MAHRLRLLLPVALFAPAPPAQEPVSAEDFAAAVTWFEALGHQPLVDTPFVRVSTGKAWRSGNEPEQNTYLDGFLRADEGRKFTVLTLGLETQTYERTPAGTAAHLRVGYEVRPLRDAARQVVVAMRLPERERQLDLHASTAWGWSATPAPGLGVNLFVLAWACRQDGEDELALEVAGAARGGFREPAGRTLQELLARDLGHVAFWRLILAFDDVERPFADLLAECGRFLERFPDCEHRQRAEETKRILARMVAEAEARPPLPDDADEDARIAELVFRLRDQNGQQWSQPGACDVFADPRGEESPAHRLAAMGQRAIPHLLPALDDDSFTRGVGFHRNFYFSHEVLRVRDVAAAVIWRITGTWPRSRAEAERAWNELQQRGELSVLVEGAEAGDLAKAARLLANHPDAALPPLRKALAQADGFERAELLALLSGLPGDEVEALLRAELAREGDVRPRLSAAIALALRGHRDEAVDAMIALWKQGAEPAAVEQVGEFLAICGARRAVEALAARPDLLDDDVLRALGGGDPWLPQVNLPGKTGRSGALERGEPEAGTVEAVERLLAGRLADGRRLRGNFGGTVDPEVRDFAASALSERWPDRYTFDFGAPRQERRRQLLAVQNVWRERQGLPPLPAPERPPVPVVDPDALADLFTSARLERSVPARSKVLDRIEALGLGALPAVAGRADEETEPERKAEWQALASRIASRVREVRLADGSAPFPEGLAETARALQDLRLDPDALAELLATFGRGDAAAPAAVALTVTRADDGTGVTVELEFDAMPRGEGDSVGYSAMVVAGRRGLCSSGGAGVRSVVGEKRHYERFTNALAEALLAPPGDPIDARYEVRFR